jgi:hypothetical protein
LRIVLASSKNIDFKRNYFRHRLKKAKSKNAKMKVMSQYFVELFTNLNGLRKGDKRKLYAVPIDDVIDLHSAVLIDFTAINPLCMGPMFDYGLYNVDNPDQRLAQFLFIGAGWLGELFRTRHLDLDPAHARILADYTDPARPPPDLPEDRVETWRAATRMVTSFLTETSRQMLFQNAREVSRQV